MIRFSKIKHNVRELFPDLVKYFTTRQEIDFAYVFGSYALHKENQLSDVDIAVYLDDTIPEDKYFDIRLCLINDISSILRTNEVDLIILNQADLLLKYQVVYSRVVLYERDKYKRIDFEVRVLDFYFDTEPLRRIQRENFKKNVEEGLIFG